MLNINKAIPLGINYGEVPSLLESFYHNISIKINLYVRPATSLVGLRLVI